MKNIRIGNDINVAWNILLRGGEPFNLEGLDVSLYLLTPFGKQKADGFVIEENKVLWTFCGRNQKYTGKYSLELVINEDHISMITTDPVTDFKPNVPRHGNTIMSFNFTKGQYYYK